MEAKSMSQAALAPVSPSAITAATYDARDLAALLKISTRTVWRLADEGSIPGKLRVGKSVRWSRRVIDSWIESGCRKSKAR
jgi:excisionase family DNA binding protein